MKVKRGDVVFLKNFYNIEGHIQGGNRPYVVVSNNTGNFYSNVCIIVPLTKSERKKPLPTHTRVRFHNSICLCEQIFTTPQDNIDCVAWHLNPVDMAKITKCIGVSVLGD